MVIGVLKVNAAFVGEESLDGDCDRVPKLFIGVEV